MGLVIEAVRDFQRNEEVPMGVITGYWSEAYWPSCSPPAAPLSRGIDWGMFLAWEGVCRWVPVPWEAWMPGETGRLGMALGGTAEGGGGGGGGGEGGREGGREGEGGRGREGGGGREGGVRSWQPSLSYTIFN